MESVRVSGIDPHCSVQVVWRYFEDRGAAVKAVYYPLLNNDAVVIFNTPSGTIDALTRNHDKWKVSPLPNQVFRQQRVWVESDLSMLVQATGAYEDALRNMGQLDITVDSKTHEMILCGQPYQIEWAWNYLSMLRDNQFHIARTLQTESSPMPTLSNGSVSPTYTSPSNERPMRSHHDTRHHQQREKTSLGGDITNTTALHLDRPAKETSSLGFRTEPFGDELRRIGDENSTLPHTLMQHLSLRGEEKQSMDATEKKMRRQDDANETFNKFASLPTSSSAARREAAAQKEEELQRLEAAHKLERHFQSLNQEGEARDDDPHHYHHHHHRYSSLQFDYLRPRDHGDSGGLERGRPRTHAGAGDRGASTASAAYLSSSLGAAGGGSGGGDGGAADLSPFMLSSASAALTRKEFQLNRRLKLKIYMADITQTQTEAVVNAANWELKNIGGVAGALAKAAGPEMAAECSKVSLKYGHLSTAQVVKTKAYGKLSHMKCVLHTVGPIYIQSDTERSIFELTQTFFNCLEYAEKIGLRSITFPFISTGIFGMPIEHCVLAIVTAVMVFADQQTAGGVLEEVHFINNDINVVCEAIIMAEQRLAMETAESATQRIEEGQKRFGRYVYPFCQGKSSVQPSSRVENDRYATWDTSQLTHRESEKSAEGGGGSSRRTPRPSSTSLTHDPSPRSLSQFGSSSESRYRSGSLDRNSSKTYRAGSSSHQPHKTSGATTSLSGGRDPSPRPQARPRSNSLTLSGRSVPSASGGSGGGTTSKTGSGGTGKQPVIKKALTGTGNIKGTGLAKKLAVKKAGGQSAGRSGGGDISGNDTDTTSAAGSEMDDGEGCLICMEPLRHARKLPCGHSFCSSCIDPAFAHNPVCPRCKAVFRVPTGDQPKDGTMTHTYNSHSDLPGYPNVGIIVIKYVFPAGKQQAHHPKPGQVYEGVHQTAYLPDNAAGNEVLKLLRKAFDHRLLFTISSSGRITSNGVHHKTSKTGGIAEDGYPDPTYLKRVKEELKAKGITSP